MKLLARITVAFLLIAIIALIALLSLKEGVFVNEWQNKHLIPQVMTVMVGEKVGEHHYVVAQATGILLDRSRGYIGIARHTARHESDHAPTELFALIDGRYYRLEKRWEHRTADIAIMAFAPGNIPPALPIEFRVDKTLPAQGSRVRLLGYFERKEPSHHIGCETVGKYFYCEKSLALEIEHADATFAQISPPAAALRMELFLQVQREFPELDLSYEDIVYDHHITTLLSGRIKPEDGYGGMSGGALVNERGAVVGIFVMGSMKRLVFVPTREIPDEFLPRR